jgi:hypothetical protein
MSGKRAVQCSAYSIQTDGGASMFFRRSTGYRTTQYDILSYTHCSTATNRSIGLSLGEGGNWYLRSTSTTITCSNWKTKKRLVDSHAFALRLFLHSLENEVSYATYYSC